MTDLTIVPDPTWTAQGDPTVAKLRRYQRLRRAGLPSVEAEVLADAGYDVVGFASVQPAGEAT